VGYRLLRRLAGLLLGLFYRQVEVVGAERVPAAGPLVVAANHQNALVDPMLLLAALPRRLRPLAKAPLFRHPLLAPFLWLAGAIPVHRRQDAGSDPAKNAAMFEAAAATLRHGGAICVFPEGLSQAEPTLMPLRTGTARIALAAAAGSGGAGVTLLPAGLVFHEPGTFRTGWALVLIGEAVALADLAALYRTAPEAAVRQLTDRLAEALRGLIVEARDRERLRLMTVAEAIWRAEGGGADGVAARADWLRRAARAYGHLAERAPDRIGRLAAALEGFAADVARAGATAGDLGGSYAPATVARYAAREAAALGLGLPFALLGLALHGVPYQLTRAVARLVGSSGDAEATYKLMAGVVLFPLAWLAEGWLAWRLGGGLFLGLFAVLLLPAGFFALGWWERLARVRRDTRGFLDFLRRRDLRARLLARRRALAAELTALAAEVPDAVLAGQPDAAPPP
jgi:1-acyl-sn-glycerol-3-phosphate acyltransferase